MAFAMVKVGIIGLGQQTLRTHVPCVELARSEGFPAEIVAIADFSSQMSTAQRAEPSALAGAKPITIDTTSPRTFTESEAFGVIEKMIRAGADAFIVATEPISHFSYVKALEKNGIHYLVDKPFICRPNISLDPSQADAAVDDLRWLQDRVTTQSPTVLGSVNITRRFDGALRGMRAVLSEAEHITGQLVTYVAAQYSDGEHRDAAGCWYQNQHSFSDGYGALNHSGYHVVDTAIWMAGLDSITTPAVVSVTAQRRTIAAFLAGEASSGKAFPRARVAESVEYDSIVNVTVERASGHSTLLSLAVIHDSCSNRRWERARNLDEQLHLGRLSHELTIAAQGELQNAFVRMTELPNPDTNGGSHLLPSRLFHADITRNPLYAKMIGRPVYEDFSPAPLTHRSLSSSSKYKAIKSFLSKAAGEPYDQMIDIDRHLTSQLTLLLAARSLANGGTVETGKTGYAAH